MNKQTAAIVIASAVLALTARAEDKEMYRDLIGPIIKAKCVECHTPEKKKGKLLMTTYAEVMAGGENGKEIVPGEPKKSRMYKQFLLPKSDDDHMPPAKKDQLTPAEIAAFRWWIEKGAQEKLKLSEAGPIPDDVKPLLEGK